MVACPQCLTNLYASAQVKATNAGKCARNYKLGALVLNHKAVTATVLTGAAIATYFVPAIRTAVAAPFKALGVALSTVAHHGWQSVAKPVAVFAAAHPVLVGAVVIVAIAICIYKFMPPAAPVKPKVTDMAMADGKTRQIKEVIKLEDGRKLCVEDLTGDIYDMADKDDKAGTKYNRDGTAVV